MVKHTDKRVSSYDKLSLCSQDTEIGLEIQPSVPQLWNGFTQFLNSASHLRY